MTTEIQDWEQYELNERRGLVQCDQRCGAKQEPETFEEAVATAEHYRSHSLIGGCSHGR